MYTSPNSRAGFCVMNKACAMHSLNDFTFELQILLCHRPRYHRFTTEIKKKKKIVTLSMNYNLKSKDVRTDTKLPTGSLRRSPHLAAAHAGPVGSLCWKLFCNALGDSRCTPW